ncbi:MAG: hypothetical protein ABIG39_06730 [Candidatus Micrarchaeota archaeon]
MTTTIFIKAIEAYYGKYESNFIVRLIAKYLGKYDENDLDGLFQCTLEHFSKKWNKSPDIAVFEEVRAKSFGEEMYQYRIRWGVVTQEGNGSFWAKPERSLNPEDFPITTHFLSLVEKGKVGENGEARKITERKV